MKKLLKSIALSSLVAMFLLSNIPAYAQSQDFSESCQTYGYYGLDDWYYVQLQDMDGNLSDSCIADDWTIDGDENAFGEIVKGEQEIKIKRKEGGSINVKAVSGSETTDDNYIMLEEANEPIEEEDEVPYLESFSDRCQTYGFYGLDDWFHVQLQDMTGNVSDSCIADDWTVEGDENAFGEVIKGEQEVKIKRVMGGSINVKAISGSETTDDNYIMLVEANDLAPPAGYEDEVIVNMDSYDNPFPDTNLQALEGIAAAELYRRAVIGGYADGEFKGYREVNRAEAAKFLLLARYGTVEDVQNNGMFPDIKDGEWYVTFVITCANLGIINGYPDGYFRPQNTVNTAEFLKMLTLTFDLDTNLAYSYADVNSNDWFAAYAGTAKKYELFPDRSIYLKPSDNLTRTEVAIAIYQYLLNR